jgi:hypothetical protein
LIESVELASFNVLVDVLRELVIALSLTIKLPDIVADPVYGNGGVDAPPGAYEALKAFVAYEAVTAYEELNALFPLVNIEPVTYEAVTAYEALIVVVAYEEVPNNDPVIPPDTFNDPVICELPSERYPFFILNSFAIS